MSTGPLGPPDSPTSDGPGQVTPLEVLRRWDDTAETLYSLTGGPVLSTSAGLEHPATAVDPGGVVRDVRVVVTGSDESADLRTRIVDHMVALGHLRNPNLGVVEALVSVDGGWGVVLPALDGRTLADLIDGGPLPARTAAEIGLEVAWGLAASHAAVVPDKIRPLAVPHGQVLPGHVTVSGFGEVVLTDYNLHHARSAGATPSDDIQSLGQLIVHAIDGAAMPALPADPELARKAIEEDLEALPGLTDELRDLLGEMLDPDPGRRPEVRSVARRLRRIIPQQEGLWLSAWAEASIGLPERERPKIAMPTPTLVAEDLGEALAPDAPTGQGDGKREVDENPQYVKKGRGAGKVKMRFPPLVIGALAVAGLLMMAGGIQVARWYVDLHGPMDMADVPTDQAGPDQAAAAGPAGPGKKGKAGEAPPPDIGPSDVTVLEAEAGIEAKDEGAEERPDRELVETDEAIDPDKKASSPIDDGSVPLDQDAVADDAPGELEAIPGGPPPWPRPAGTLGDFDLFVEVPLAQKLVLKCTNGLTMEGPSAFRAAIMKSTPTECVAEASMRGDIVAQAPIVVDRTLDLICRHGFHTDLRCVERPTGRDLGNELPDAVELEPKLSDIRVRAPLASSMRVSCVGRSEAEDVERLQLTQVGVGPCKVTAELPDGAYAGTFMVVENAEFMCMRDFSGPPDAEGRRPLRCAPSSTQ